MSKDICLFGDTLQNLKKIIEDFSNISIEYKSISDRLKQINLETNEKLDYELAKLEGYVDKSELKINQVQTDFIKELVGNHGNKDLQEYRERVVKPFISDFELLKKNGIRRASDMLQLFFSEALSEYNAYMAHASDMIVGSGKLKPAVEIFSTFNKQIEKKLRSNGFSLEQVNDFKKMFNRAFYQKTILDQATGEYKIYKGYTEKDLLEFQKANQGKDNYEELLTEFKKFHSSNNPTGRGGFLQEIEKQFNKEYEYMSANFKQLGLEDIFDSFIMGVGERLINVQNKVRKDLNKMNDVEFNKTKNTETYLDDLMGMFSGDVQYITKKRIGTSQTDFEKAFLEQYELQNGQALEFGSKEFLNVKKMGRMFYNSIIDRKTNAVSSIIKNMQSVFFTMKYGMGSFGLGALGMYQQVAANQIEMNSVFKTMNTQDFIYADNLLNRVGGIGEDGFMFGTGLERERLDDTLMGDVAKKINKFGNKQFERIFRLFGIKDEEKITRLRNTADFFVFNPMTLDALHDRQRMIAAANKVAKKFGPFIETMDNTRIRNYIRNEYANIGGGVLSSSPLYRETIISMLDPEKNGYLFSDIFMTLFRFLNGWGINKLVNFYDVQLNGMKGINTLMRGMFDYNVGARDIEIAHMSIRELLQFNIHLLNGIGQAIALYGTFEKYNHDDDNNKINAEKFLKGIMNQYVAFEVILGNEYETLKAMFGDGPLTPWQEAQLGAMNRIKRMLNFTKINGFIPAMYDYVKFNGFDMVGAYQYARDKQLGGMFRFANMVTRNGLETGQFQQDPLSSLGIAPLTKEQELQNDFKTRETIKVLNGEWSFFGGLLDLKYNFFPTNSMLIDEESRKVIDDIMKDRGIRELYLNGAVNYNLENMFKANPEAIKQMYEDIVAKGLNGKLGANTNYEIGLEMLEKNVEDSNKKRPYKDMIDKYMVDILKDKGMTLQDFVDGANNFVGDKEGRREIYAKLYAALSTSKDVEVTKYVVPYLIDLEYRRLKDANYKVTRKGIDYSSDEGKQFDILLKYHALNNNLDLLDINNEAKGVLAEYHIKTFLNDKFKNIGEEENKRIRSTVDKHVQLQLLATANLKESGTNVAYLKSNFAVLLNNIVPKTEEASDFAAKYILNTLTRIEYSNLGDKERAARKGALLLSLTNEGIKSVEGIPLFESFSKEGKIQIANWYYKTTEEFDQLTQTIIGDNDDNPNGLNGSGGFGKGSKWSKWSKKPFTPYPKKPFIPRSPMKRGGYDANGFGQRPGFNKQIPQEIPNMFKPYIRPNSGDIVNNSIRSNRPAYVKHQAQKPLQNEIRLRTLRAVFDSYYSKDMFREIRFKDDDPRYSRYGRYAKTQRVNVDTSRYGASSSKSKALPKTYAKKPRLDPNLAGYTDLVGSGSIPSGD